MHLWSVVFDEPGKRTWRTASSPDNWVYRCNYCDLRVESPKGERPEGGLCASAGGPTLEERWLAAQPGCPRCGGRTHGRYGGELLCWLCYIEAAAEPAERETSRGVVIAIGKSSLRPSFSSRHLGQPRAASWGRGRKGIIGNSRILTPRWPTRNWSTLLSVWRSASGAGLNTMK